MININPDFFKESIPESESIKLEDSKELDKLKLEAYIENLKLRRDEIKLELRKIELEHQEKEYSIETLHIIKQYKELLKKIEGHIIRAEHRLTNLA